MNDINHHDDASLDDFVDGWRTEFANEQGELFATVTYAVIGWTNFGEYPVASTRLAELLGRSVSEAEALAKQWGWPGTRVENGLITIDPESAATAARRRARIGDRQFGVSGCAADVFLYAPLVRPSIHMEETCPTTGTPIRIEFTPNRVETVHPSGAVVAMVDASRLSALKAEHIDDFDAALCGLMPFFSSAEAAEGWRADYPYGRVFTISQAWDLSLFRDWRDRMSALLNLDN